eukprot:2313920-Pyramimonas_sp.AAC.1
MFAHTTTNLARMDLQVRQITQEVRPMYRHALHCHADVTDPRSRHCTRPPRQGASKKGSSLRPLALKPH